MQKKLLTVRVPGVFIRGRNVLVFSAFYKYEQLS